MPGTVDSAARLPATATAADAKTRAGLVYAISAYTMWGVFPIYFHFLSHVSSLVVVCHRIFWSSIFLAVVISVRTEWSATRPVLRSRRNMLLLSGGAVLLGLNWLIFVYSIATHQVLQASLGYFINPLLSIALGMVFLRERLRGWQWVAVLFAVLAVVNLELRGSGFPWLAVSLAVTFGFYGLVRKKVDINSLHGLLVESWILLPLSLIVILSSRPQDISTGTYGILSLSGFITAVPLLCFGAALRRLPLSMMGFLQYIGPTLQFTVAVVLFHEALDRAKLASFALCWVGIGVYVLDSILARSPQPVADEPE